MQTVEYRYTVIFEPGEDHGYVVKIPALGIATQGRTLREARAMAKDAIRGYLECLEKDGLKLPATEPLTESIAFTRSRA